MRSPETTSSTRRFCCRPAAVSLVATGWPSPSPNAPRWPTGSAAPRDRHEPIRRGAREPLVGGFRADAVGVTFDLDSESRVRDEDARQAGQLFSCARLQVRARGVEQHVGQVDDQATRGLARLEDHIQLIAELLLATRPCPVRTGPRRPAPAASALRPSAALTLPACARSLPRARAASASARSRSAASRAAAAVGCRGRRRGAPLGGRGVTLGGDARRGGRLVTLGCDARRPAACVALPA